ncbi:hypothetical protein [Streptomyces phaeoluteigriseus]|uniref:hypothetical protein n=1 Tax=Streptomyces phaeoluteigriseus TaxID=114686 RepID=UPI0036A0DA8B
MGGDPRGGISAGPAAGVVPLAVLADHGEGTVDGADIATVLPSARVGAVEEVTGRRDGDRPYFYDEGDDGDSYGFALDQWVGRECPVLRRDHLTGDEEHAANSFAGFPAVRTALALGLGDGPNRALARLWRWTPGILLPNGIHVYGPHVIRERNDTYEVRRYAPRWTLDGDDGDDSGLFMRHHTAPVTADAPTDAYMS